jgi:hypothetical protein
MQESTIFYLGLFVTLLLLSGVVLTGYEFKKMYRQEEKDSENK